jgi:hypothetical protein
MNRVVALTWKDGRKNEVEIFSNLKILSATYPLYNYNTLNNYLSKAKMAYENEQVRIERVVVQKKSFPIRKMAMIVTRVKMREHDETAKDTDFWLSRPAAERLEAVTRLSGMLKMRKNERMDKTHVVKRKL